MSPKQGFYLICTVLLAVGLLRVSIDNETQPGSAPLVQEVAAIKVAESSHTAIQHRVTSDTPVQDKRQLVLEALRDRFASTIDDAHTRIKALEKLVAYLKAHYPNSWREQLANYLGEVFPEHAADMLAMFDSMESYNLWVESERQNMLQMNPEQRRALLWEMRYSFFGDAANEIWSEVIKNEQIARSLESMTHEQDFASNTQDFVTSIEQAYGDRAERVKDNRQQEFSDRFLSVPVIQEQLKSMAAEERRQALAQFRQQLGMDKDAIERWRELDDRRDARRAIGKQYMRQRSELENTMEGEELRLALNALQNKLFGAEAETLRNEEASGFYRFRQEQIIGRN